MTKKIKTVLRAAMVTTVLCAGALSARQLSQAATTTTCRGFCSKNVPCPGVLGCGCVFNNPGATTGVCSFIAAKPASQAK
jgi:hypothetical protein